MMGFVEHEKTEAIANLFHVDESRIISRDGHGLQIVSAAANHPAMDMECIFEIEMPLCDQIERRGNDEGWALFAHHRHLCDIALSRASGQYDKPAATIVFPGLDSFGLIIKWHAFELKSQRNFGILLGVVDEIDLIAGKRRNQSSVCNCLSPEGLDSFVPHESGQMSICGIAHRFGDVHHKRPAIE